MENGWSFERSSLIRELIQGMELAKQLRLELHSSSSIERRELLAGRILSSFEKALLILKWREPVHPPPTVSASPSLPFSAAAASPATDGFDTGLHGLKAPAPSKKRKMAPLLTGKVRVSSERELEGPQEDGFCWRKYGQKDILGAKHPRSYYKCTFRNSQNCWAVKQVQRSDEDPSVFEITYRGSHSCSHGPLSVPPRLPVSEEEEEGQSIHNKQSQDQKTWVKNTDASESKDETSAVCFPATSIGSIGCIESKPHHYSVRSFSQSVLSPATPESNSYFPSPCQSSNFGGIHNMVYSESENFPAMTSATNSAVPSLNFSLDPAQMDPSFTFDTLGFFS